MSKDKTILLCVLSCLIVFAFYSHTLNYGWRDYDENIILNETLLPVPQSFGEFTELIKHLGVNQYFGASNQYYSSIVNLRSDPVTFFLLLFISLIFQKNSFLYHLFSLGVHILNTALCFLILNKFARIFTQSKTGPLKESSAILSFCLSLFWALHPANVEAVILSTNWAALIGYCVCFITTLYCLNIFFPEKEISPSQNLFKKVLITTVFFVSLFIHEYLIFLPLILTVWVFTIFGFTNQTESNKEVIYKTFKSLYLLWLCVFIYLIYTIFSHTFPSHLNNSFLLAAERIILISPSVFIHLIKLIFYPVNLSMDQSGLVQISSSFLSKGTLLKTSLFYLPILLSFFFLTKRKNLIFLIGGLYLSVICSLVPFLHIISPLYNLASERYLYFPMVFVCIISLYLILEISKNPLFRNKIVLLFILIILIFPYSYRSYLRTLDWKDTSTLFNSSIMSGSDKILKALRLSTLPEPKNTEAVRILDETIVETRRRRVSTPKIIKFYGLAPKTRIAKSIFLKTFIEYNTNPDNNKAYESLSPYINDLGILDAGVLGFYYKILFITKRIDEAEKLLKDNLRKGGISPILFVAYSDLMEYKYHDLSLTEKYLKKSFKYFPYDSGTLFGLKRLYSIRNNPEQFALYSYLFGLRTHDLQSILEAAYIYKKINKEPQAEKIIKIAKDLQKA